MLGDIELNLHPLQVLGDGNAARVIPFFGAGPFPGRHTHRLLLGYRILRPLRLLKGFQQKVVEHHLIGVEFLGAGAINTLDQLLHLMLKHLHGKIGRAELFG